MAGFRIRGVITPIVTPFCADGTVDETAFRRLVAWQVEEGADGLVVGAAEGEGWSLTDHERVALLTSAIRECGDRVRVIGALLSNGTAEARRQAALLRDAGADAALLASPCYNKPTMDGVVAHVAQVAAVGLPLVIANAPGRSAIDLLPATIARIATIPGVVGVLDNSRDLARPLATLTSTPPSFIQLCGADELMTTFNLNGGMGAVATVANIVPKTCVWLQQACQAHDWLAAQRLQHELTGTVGMLPTFGLAAALKARLLQGGRLQTPAVRLPEVAPLLHA
jgi:4-hydroxy-tetrahydrodipicolinate synthase